MKIEIAPAQPLHCWVLLPFGSGSCPMNNGDGLNQPLCAHVILEKRSAGYTSSWENNNCWGTLQLLWRFFFK